MFRSHPVGRLFGVDIRIHGTVGLLVGLLTLISLFSSGLLGAAWTLGLLLMVGVSITLHELGHIGAARLFGIHTTGITLFPFGGVAQLTREARSGKEEVAVALAGPAVNLALASVAALPLFLLGPVEPFLTFLGVNLALAIFNLIPAYPMDGGRVLRGALWGWLGHRQATVVAARAGQAFAVLFGIAGLFMNPMLVVIALFVFMHASAELTRMRQVRPALPPGWEQQTGWSHWQAGPRPTPQSRWQAGPQPGHPHAWRAANPPQPQPQRAPRLVQVRTPWGTYIAWEQ